MFLAWNSVPGLCGLAQAKFVFQPTQRMSIDRRLKSLLIFSYLVLYFEMCFSVQTTTLFTSSLIETQLMNRAAQSKRGPNPIFGKCIHVGIRG